MQYKGNIVSCVMQSDRDTGTNSLFADKQGNSKGFFSGFAYWLMPDYISHSWVEVNIDGRWRRIDSFINDIDLHNAAVMELEKRNWTVGFSRALSNGSANAYLNIDNESFSQMAAVKDDHGTWEEPADYYASHHYRNRPGFLKLMFYRIAIGRINKRVERVRKEYRNIHSNQIKNN